MRNVFVLRLPLLILCACVLGAATAQAAEPGWMMKAMAIQQDYYRSLARAFRGLGNEFSLAAAWTLMSISFAYGIFHAVGPGHGKIVVSSYLAANEREIRKGILLAFLTSFAQALTAILAVTILALLLGLGGRATAAAVPLIERVSFVALIALGGWLLWRSLKTFWDNPAPQHDLAHHDHNHDHAHCSHHGHAHLPAPADIAKAGDWRSQLGMILAVGLRPCTGGILVMLFALSQGALLIGIASTFLMSLGTALTVSALAIVTLLSKNLALRLAGSTDNRLTAKIETGLRIAGGFAILLMGVFLLIGSFVAPPSPLL